MVSGKWMATSPNEGGSGEDGSVRDFLVIHDQPSHPILKGLPTEWMHAADELYGALRGPVKNVEVLAHAFSLITKEAEPVMMIITYGKGAIVMRKTEGERTTGPRPRGQGLYDEEIIPNARAQGRFDASLEEILHMVSDVGWAGAYPEVFGRVPGTEISNALDKARGGRFIEVPEHYPEDAWFTYDDKTCDYDCQNSEYIYWVLTSILGAQDFPGRYEQIKDEWRLNTREKVKEGDPDAYALFTDPKYKFPTVLPDGKYRAKTFTIQKYP